MSRRFWVAALATLGLAVATPAVAVTEQAGENAASGTFSGIQGNQNIRTDPATHTGEGYVHPFQVIKNGTTTPDFVAIGSANGLGVDNCPNQYNAKWDIYIDGQISGVYFCRTEDANRYSAGDNPGHQITRVNCGTVHDPLYGWETRMSGTTWACVASAWAPAGNLAAGLEHIGPDGTDRNIDVKFTQLETLTSGTWSDWGNRSNVTANNYTVDHVSSRAFNAFLAPLD